MYNVGLDENNFYNGSYAEVGTVPNGVDVETLPPAIDQLCYYLDNGVWVYSEDKRIELMADMEAKHIAEVQEMEAAELYAAKQKAIIDAIETPEKPAAKEGYVYELKYTVGSTSFEWVEKPINVE